MKLKRVKIYGFKTFAEKTEIDLDGNIIAVVGPNGCGKSNIVDSILWALGETSPKSLRAAAGQDVIFNGSAARKPIGFSEVTLLFDNEDGSLPMDSPEVSITRRLSRSGDSGFAINKRSCRLKDIVDLLADSGLGRTGYAIVGQSEIDQALAASAGQRRAWIDEAAGVQRYRIRRTEALRRLDSATQHLDRLADLMREIDAQREPLEQEATDAKRYKELVGALRGVELGLLARELADSARELNELNERRSLASAQAEAESARADALEREAAEANERGLQLEARMELIREARQKAAALAEQARASAQIAAGKIENLTLLAERMEEEAGAAADRMAQAKQDLDSAQKESAEAQSAQSALRESVASTDGESRRLAAELSQAESALKAAREALAKRQRAELEQAHREDRLASVKAELEGIEATLPDLAEALAEAETSVAAQAELVAAARTEITEIQAKRKGLAESLEKRHHERRRLLAELATLDGRRRGIEATIQSHEGLAHGARAVMAMAAQGRLESVYTPVGEAIEVDPDLALALDTALGGSANDLIVPHDGHAKKAIELLKQERLGRATFQPLNLVRGAGAGPEVRDLLRQKGIVGMASDLVRCDAQNRSVIESLLGRVLIVEDLDTALRHAKTRGWSRMVTLDGEVVHGSGAVTGGHQKHQAQGMVQRKADLAELEDDLKEIQATLDKLDKGEGQSGSADQTLQAQLTEVQARLASAQRDHEEARGWLMSVQHEQTATLRSQAKLQTELASLQSSEAALGEPVEIAPLEARRDELMHALAAKTSDAGAATERLQEAESRLEAAQRRLKEAERRLAHLIEAEELRHRRSENLDPERERWTAQQKEAELELAQQTEALEARSLELTQTTDLRRAATAEAANLQEEARQAQKAAQAQLETVHHVEISRARADSRRAAATQRLLEEYGVTPEEALEATHGQELPDDAASAVAKLRREIKAMGDVNLGAIEAYERLTERSQELHAQTDDILSGKAEIESGIRELDRLTRERFLSTFRQLQEAFAGMFERIFSGGEGSLELTNDHDVLDSGVEISVTIPGKKRQRLELLSGGERALSALAFLFALLKVKPSPLVILDEVDAPLDGRNVERFIAMMREFAETTQFILITHNPTTIAAADVWFGVTMQEPGVSTVVPFRVPGEAGPAGQTGHNVSLKG